MDPLWAELRENPEAAWISLAFPGFLLRTAYGPEGKRAKTFDFSEALAVSADLLWGNSCFPVWGSVLARAFAKSGGIFAAERPVYP